jgi:hypothetical protein
MTETVLLFIAIAWSGIQFGTLWIMFTSILPLLNTRGPKEYLDTCQGIYMHFFHPIALWGGISIMVVGLYVGTQLNESVAQILSFIGAAGMLGVGVISETQNRPLWRKLEKWTVDELPDNWEVLRKNWSNAHGWRTLSAGIAVVAFTLAAIIEYT